MKKSVAWYNVEGKILKSSTGVKPFFIFPSEPKTMRLLAQALQFLRELKTGNWGQREYRARCGVPPLPARFPLVETEDHAPAGASRQCRNATCRRRRSDAEHARCLLATTLRTEIAVRFRLSPVPVGTEDWKQETVRGIGPGGIGSFAGKF